MRASGMPCSSATIVEPNSQLSRMITSGGFPSTMALSPGSSARTSIPAKNSPIITSFVVAMSSSPNSPISGIHSSRGGSSKPTKERPVRSTLSLN
jgi:hypothetical protein